MTRSVHHVRSMGRVAPEARSLEVTPATIVGALAVALSFGLLACISVRYAIDAPIIDQWSMVEDLGKYAQGTWTWSDIARSHNGHRIALPRLILIPLAFVSGWRMRVEVVLNLACGMGIFAVLLFSQLRELRDAWTERGALLAAALATVCFSLTQWENWIWGIQINVFLAVLLALLAILSLSRWPRSGAGFAMALTAALLGSLTQSGGLAIWPAGLASILSAGPGAHRLRRAAVWGVSGGVVAALYLVPLAGDTPSYASPGFLVMHPFQAAHFFLNVLGRPLAAYAGSAWPVDPSWVPALFAAAALGLLLQWSWPELRLGVRQGDARVSFLLGSAAFSVTVAGLITLGRAPSGSAAALASRYITLMTPLWASALAFAVVRGWPGPAQPPLHRERVLLCIALLSILGGSLLSVPEIADRYHFIRPGREALLQGGPREVRPSASRGPAGFEWNGAAAQAPALRLPPRGDPGTSGPGTARVRAKARRAHSDSRHARARQCSGDPRQGAEPDRGRVAVAE
jgi:hypothetical protein